VRVIAQQWAWTFVHAGPDGVLDTADDIRTVEDMHVQVNRVYHFELHSRDVVHSFSVPVFRLKQDAVPGRSIQGLVHADPDRQRSTSSAPRSAASGTG
jgi:cytochrome c oxidase subunit II